MSESVIYGDISPRLSAKSWKQLLERIQQLIVLQRWAEVKPLGRNQTKSVVFRRYNTLSVPVIPLSEGRTPAARKVTTTDIPVTVQQYGEIIRTTDVVGDTHPDPVISQFSDI